MTPSIHPRLQDSYLRALALYDEETEAGAAYSALQAAAAEGDDRAKYAIATWYLHGMDGVVEKNIEAGVALLKELIDSNVAEALFDLAVSYDYGWGTRKNERRAFSCYMKAALLGHAESCGQIAEFYREGTFVKPDTGLYRAWKTRSQHEERDISPPYRQWLRPEVPSATCSTEQKRDNN